MSASRLTFSPSTAGQPVSDAVITVPPYFNQAERRSMALAAEIAGLNLLQLINDNTAAGINYGMFRRKEFNETAQTVLIYDMGATKTTATVYGQYRIPPHYRNSPILNSLWRYDHCSTPLLLSTGNVGAELTSVGLL